MEKQGEPETSVCTVSGAADCRSLFQGLNIYICI